MLVCFASADFYVSDVGSVSPPLAISAGCSCCHIDAPAPIRFASRGLRYRYGTTSASTLRQLGSCSCWLASTVALPGFESTAACSVTRSKFFTLHHHSLRLFVENLRCPSEIYSRSKCSLYPPEKTFRVSDVFEEGYNELINEAINLALTCAAYKKITYFCV